jgi:N-acetylglutamate synthase-like GNAT family acetyltransferase
VSDPYAVDSSDPLGERVADWYAETNRARASTATPLSRTAWSLLTPTLPKSFATNAILVRDDPGADQLIAWADDALGAYTHRYVSALCDLRDDTRADLTAAGYQLTGLVTMARELPGELVATAADVVVEAADDEAMARLHTVLWRTEWLPGIGDDDIEQLVARRALEIEGISSYSWVVHDAELDDPVSGDLAACLELHVHGWAAEIDAVATRAPARGRRYADALMAVGVSAAYEQGCTHAVLSALTDDWPLHWYARRGFHVVGVAWEALRRLDGLAFASAS